MRRHDRFRHSRQGTMTERERTILSNMLECHREMMLERAEACGCERIARACRAVAEKDATMIVNLSRGCALRIEERL